MSTLSISDRDQSDQLAKRFAFLASSYFDSPDEAQAPAAKIPLENLFRILQMYRYDAFSDERRSGILEAGGISGQVKFGATEGYWHEKIKDALDAARANIYGDTPKISAVDEVQSALAWLATRNNAPSTETRNRSKRFLERFATVLD